jgi:hypothetical protein
MSKAQKAKESAQVQRQKQPNETPRLKQTVVTQAKAVGSPRDFGTVHRYRNLAQQSAEYIPALGRAFNEAKEGLAPSQVRNLCKELGFQKGSGVYEELVKIGENAERFQPYLKRLPSDRFVLYRLAVMEQTEFQLVVQSDLFSPAMTFRDLENISKFPKKGLFIDLSGLELAMRTEACREIEGLKKRFRFGLKPSDQPKDSRTIAS